MGPLSGVVVLDLSRLLPGPFATQLLVDMGATVVKIEEPHGGDYVRHMPPLLKDGTSALFHAVNRGKKSVCLDLKSDAGRDAFHALCAGADVVVESFRPGVLERLGLAPEELLRRHPRLVVCSISGYGQTGPDRLRAGHDVNYVARAGALGMMARPDLLPVQVGDLAGGAWPAAFQIAAALYGRERTGRGALVDVSMTDGVHALLAMSLARFAAGEERIGQGRDVLVGAVPSYGVYETKDGFVSVGALEPKFWLGLCAALGLDELSDQGLATGEEGARARAVLQAKLRENTTAEWDAIFRTLDVCVEPVRSPEDAWRGGDAQLASRGLVVDVEIGGETVRLPRTALETTGASASTARAPALGEHTEELLRAAGLDGEQLRMATGG